MRPLCELGGFAGEKDVSRKAAKYAKEERKGRKYGEKMFTFRGNWCRFGEMRRFFVIGGLVFVLCGFAFGQVSNCPTVWVDGPSGIVNPGQKITFTASVDSKVEIPNLQYIWTVDKGNIASGQNTTSINVLSDGPGITATLLIKGLPSGCVNEMSARYDVCILPVAVKLDEFVGSLDKIEIERFAEIVKAAKSDPNAQLYAIISGNAKNPLASINRKRVIIVNQILRKLGDELRMTYVHSQKNDDRVVIYLVPPGADNPIP